MTDQEAHGQAFENGRAVGDAEGYARGKSEAVKHGRWCFMGTWEECSICGYAIAVDGERMNYCPNCGAKMNG